jgi:Transposase IS4
MIKFKDRTLQKIIIPGKPISTEFKIFALRDSGYTYNWECIRPSLSEGVLTEKQRISIFLNPIQSVVIRLIKYLSIYIEKRRSFHLFLDNLFICWKSAIALKERGIAVTRTVRKGASEYPPRLLQLKKLNRGLIWGALQASIIGGVCYWFWQDSNAVMGTWILFIYYILLYSFFIALFLHILFQKKLFLYWVVLFFEWFIYSNFCS